MIDVVAICPFDGESVMIFGNDENDQARVFRFYFLENYTWERDAFGQVLGAVQTLVGLCNSAYFWGCCIIPMNQIF